MKIYAKIVLLMFGKIVKYPLKSNRRQKIAAFFGILTVFLSGTLLLQTLKPAEAKGEGAKIVTVFENGEKTSFKTDAKTVKEALSQQNIILAKEDNVEPSLNETLTDTDYSVNIYRAAPYIIVDGNSRTKTLSAAKTAKKIAETAGIKIHNEDIVSSQLSTNTLEDGTISVLNIKRAKLISVKIFGKEEQIRTQAETIADFLKEKNINLTEKDGISKDRSEKISAGDYFEIWRNGKQTITVEEEIAFQTEKIQDASKEASFREVKEKGENGKKTVTYEIEMRNGVEFSRTKITEVEIKAAKKQVEVVGTKNNYSSSLNEWLLALRTCETGGNYSRNSGNGYYGAYQFLPSTWNSIAKRIGRPDLVGVMPHLASPADQDAMVIANANATAGLSTQHPGCYKKLGLSNKPPAN